MVLVGGSRGDTMRRTKFKGARVAEISARQSEFEGNLVDFHLLAEPDEVELAPEAIGDEG